MLTRHWLLAAAVAAGILIGVLYLVDTGNEQDALLAMPEVSADVRSAGEELGFVFAQLPRPIPELRFIDRDGRVLDLDAFRGRVVLLNLWATWCIPCRKEMPSLDRLQARLGGPEFLVLPLSIDSGGLEAVKAFYQELELDAIGVFVDESGMAANALNIIGILLNTLSNPDNPPSNQETQ